MYRLVGRCDRDSTGLNFGENTGTGTAGYIGSRETAGFRLYRTASVSVYPLAATNL
eukprot:SAG31_NODE_5408_length_2552_cov_1.220546_2_plen_56_part_00